MFQGSTCIWQGAPAKRPADVCAPGQMSGLCQVAFTGCNLSTTLVTVNTRNEYMASPYFGCLWELRPFYYLILTRYMNKWIAGHGRVAGQVAGGPAIVQTMAKMFLSDTPAILVLSSKYKAAQQPRRELGRRDKWYGCMVSSGWLLAFVLSSTAGHCAVGVRVKAVKVFEAIVSTACRGGFSIAPRLSCYVAALERLSARHCGEFATCQHVVVCCVTLYFPCAASFVPLRS